MKGGKAFSQMLMRRIGKNYIYKDEEPSVIRVPKHKLEEYKAVAIEIEKRTEDLHESNHMLRFSGKNHYPTIEDMLEHKVAYQLRKFLPTLIFYSMANINDDSSAYKDSKDYIGIILDRYVEPIEDEDIKAVETLNRTTWNEMSLEQRVNCFKPLLKYYKENEFEDFLLDLGWQKFMVLDEYKKKDFTLGLMPEETAAKLEEVWNSYHKHLKTT